MPEQPGIDPVDQLELRVAVGASEERLRHEVAEAVKSVRDDLRRDIKLYVGLGVLGGNAVAAYVMAHFGTGPTQAPATALHVARVLVGL